MKTLTEEQFNNYWVEFINFFEKAGLKDYQDIDELKKAMKYSAAATSDESGAAYPGALLRHINLVCALGLRLAKMVSNTFPITEESLLKVCILNQLSKVEMFVLNDNDWEVTKRGLNYKFLEQDGCLKLGERSLLKAMSSGIKFTPIEFEAMRVLDRTPEELKLYNGRLSMLSIIVKTANDMAFALEKEQWKNENK